MRKFKPEVAFVNQGHWKGAGLAGSTQEVVPARSLPIVLSSQLIPEAEQT